jgi:hypothetical protein
LNKIIFFVVYIMYTVCAVIQLYFVNKYDIINKYTDFLIFLTINMIIIYEG